MPSWRSFPTADRISALPDSLLYHILSFLPTKIAVATSVLSKRWKPLWQSVLTLDFDDQSFTDFASFRHFVYSVIISRYDAALPIRSFRIRCGKSENFESGDLNQHCDDSSGEFNGFPNLVRANFSGDIQHFPFAWFRNAKYLHAELWSAYDYDVPTFHNLTHLELVFHSNSWKDAKWKWVIQVLQHCPKLQNLTIDEADKSELIIHDGGWKDPETIPDCLLYRLRTCCLPDFRGNECEHRFVKYVLLNSKQLNTMTIKSDYPGVDENAKFKIGVRLGSNCRASRTCSICFDDDDDDG